MAMTLTLDVFASGLTGLMTTHWVVGGIVASLIWFFAGHQSSTNKKPQLALGWLSVAVLVIVALCGWAVVKEEWLGLVCGLVVLYIEVWSIKRIAKQASG
jgi:hypothetical protein